MEDSELGFDETNGIGDGFSVVHSGFSSFGVGLRLVVAPLNATLEFDLLGASTLVLFITLVGGVGKTLVEGGDFTFEVEDLDVGGFEEGDGGGTGIVVLGNPGFVLSAFDFAGLGDLFEEVVDEGEDLLDGVSVSLDGGGGGDLGEELEDLVPRVSLEGLGVALEVFRDLDEGLGLEALLEEGSGETVFDDFLGSFDDVGGSVVLLLFGGPVSIVFSLVFVELDDSVTGVVSEVVLLGEEFFLFISDGSLFVDFVLEFGRSILGGLDFGGETGDFALALSADGQNVCIVVLLFSIDVAFGVLEEFDEVFDGIARSHLDLDGVEDGLAEARLLHLGETLNGLLLLGEGVGADYEESETEYGRGFHVWREKRGNS